MSRAPIPLLALLTLLLFTLLATPGVTPWYLGPAAALETLLTAAPFALAYLLAAWGFGSFVTGGMLAARSKHVPPPLQLPLGLALMLTLSHLMGITGLLRTGTTGLILAYLPITIGIILFTTSPSRKRRMNPNSSFACAKGSYLILAAAPALAALLLAACAPPGTLWQSEARGFDVLSYHLQLPREWLAAGRIAPLEHNAYSWLPSYMEAAYTHLGAMTSFLAQDPFTQSTGPATIASQLLHALIAIAAAVCISTLVSTTLQRHTDQPDQCRFASTLAALLFLTTPWVIVTASLAYNEMPVCLFLAAALIVCESTSRIPIATGFRAVFEPPPPVLPGEVPESSRAEGATAAARPNHATAQYQKGTCVTPVRCGALLGLLVAAACCAKPTALFMVGVPVGLLLLIRTPPRDWLRTFSAAAIVGLLMLAPWLTRNTIASANPVFPYLTSLLGDAHWSPLEVARWTLGHHESASISSRILLLFSNRGFGHEHWWPIAVVGTSTALVLLAIRRARAAAMIALLILLLQCSLWLGIGHLQSRFLLPTAVVLVIPIAAAASLAFSRRRRSTMTLVGLAITAAACAPPLLLLRETRRAPAALVVAGVPFMTGDSIPLTKSTAPDARQQLESDLAPQQYINLGLAGPIQRLYLLGDSTPFYYHVPLLYHTTWDPSPLGSFLRTTNHNLATAAQQLAAPPPQPGGGPGVSHILINFSELHRLHADRWYDPDATTAVAEQLIRDHGRLIKEWQLTNTTRIALIELVPTPP